MLSRRKRPPRLSQRQRPTTDMNHKGGHGSHREEIGLARDVKSALLAHLSKCARPPRHHQSGAKPAKNPRTSPLRGAARVFSNGDAVSAKLPDFAQMATRAFKVYPVQGYHHPHVSIHLKPSAGTFVAMYIGKDRMPTQPTVPCTPLMASCNAPPPITPACTRPRQCWITRSFPSYTPRLDTIRMGMQNRTGTSPSR